MICVACAQITGKCTNQKWIPTHGEFLSQCTKYKLKITNNFSQMSSAFVYTPVAWQQQTLVQLLGVYFAIELWDLQLFFYSND